MKKILILGVASVQYDAIKYLKENFNDVEIHAVAAKNDGPGAEVADYFNNINILDIDSLEMYIGRNDIDCVYSVGSDLAMPVVAELSEKLDLPHFISSDTALKCNNKNLFRQELGTEFEGNIPYQILYSSTDFDEDYFSNYPLFLKPSDSQGQRGIRKINSFDEVSLFFGEAVRYSRNNAAIIEQYVGGTEISVNGYMVNGKLVICEISDRITWPKYEGLIHKHIIPSSYSDKVKISVENLLQRVSTKLNIINGPVYAQMKIENEKPYVIEVTPRLDGCHMWKLINSSKGLNLLDASFKHLLYNETDGIVDNDKGVKRTLEFICQEPHTKASYSKIEKNGLIDYFEYYNEGDDIRSINGKYEKIGYRIY